MGAPAEGRAAASPVWGESHSAWVKLTRFSERYMHMSMVGVAPGDSCANHGCSSKSRGEKDSAEILLFIALLAVISFFFFLTEGEEKANFLPRLFVACVYFSGVDC